MVKLPSVKTIIVFMERFVQFVVNQLKLNIQELLDSTHQPKPILKNVKPNLNFVNGCRLMIGV